MVERSLLVKTLAVLSFLIAIYLLSSKTDQKFENLTYFRPLNLGSIQPVTNFSSQSLCDIFVGTEMENQHIAIVRLLGPSLPPLQSPQQMSLNLKHLLLHEQTLRSSHHCVKSLWVVGCNYNFTERYEIISTLIKNNQNFSGICSFRQNLEKISLSTSISASDKL